uniref:Integrase catalytic domain-containing protein n=1 Tax=Ditylenchus dipsaci TaxID=166011 RepID=A0A915DZB2_9BILA
MTIQVFATVFATHGLPEEIVTDNGPQFISKEFEEFCISRSIKHTTSSPYHQQSNGLAEKFVHTLKKAILKGTSSGLTKLESVRQLLIHYRSTPHPSSGKSPSELLYGRRIRTLLDTMVPSEVHHRVAVDDAYTEALKRNYISRPQQKNFEIGQTVYSRDYGKKGIPWVPSTLRNRLVPMCGKYSLTQEDTLDTLTRSRQDKFLPQKILRIPKPYNHR